MYARNQLAVLDHNSAVNRKQAETKDGTPRIKSQFTKITEHWVVKDIRERKDKNISLELLLLLL